MPISLSKFSKAILILIISILLILSNLITFNIFDLRLLFPDSWVVVLIISSIILMLVIKCKFLFKGKLVFLLLWELLIISIFISKYIHGEFNFLQFCLYSLIVPLSFFGKGILNYKGIFLTSSVISIIPFLFLIAPGNSLAINICAVGINFLIILSWKNVNMKYKYLCILFIAILLFITESRTSLIAFFIVSCLYTVLNLKNEIISIRKLLERTLIILLSFILLYLSYDFVVDLLFHKYTGTASDLTSGRSIMWEGTYKNGVTLFGNGETYFSYMYGIADAHNSFIQTLGAYGLISFIFFVLLSVFVIVKSICHRQKIEYICFFSGFYLLGFAENLFFIESRMTLINLMFFMYLGCLFNENKPISYKVRKYGGNI